MVAPVSSTVVNTASAITRTVSNAGDLVLSLDTLVRSVGIQRTVPHTLLLGAGASVSSGVPSAETCIWEWKRNLFLTNNPGLEDQFEELSLASVQHRIQLWLDKQGTYPERGATGEYGHYIQQCFPHPRRPPRLLPGEGSMCPAAHRVSAAMPSCAGRLDPLRLEYELRRAVCTYRGAFQSHAS